MTTAEAYQVLNVSPGAGLPEMERVYKAALQTLQLQLVPGQPVDVRQKAQAQIAELKSAFEFLKNTAVPTAQPAWAGVQPQPQVRPTVVPQTPTTTIPRIQPMATPPSPPAAMPRVQPTAIPQVQPATAGWAQPWAGFPVQPTPMPAVPPMAGFPAQPPAMTPNPFGQGPTGPTYPWVIPAGFVLAAVAMLLIIVLCVGSTIALEGQKTARLRVLSVPWAQVKVDGRSLGPSGQIDAFAVKPGEHEVVLRQGNRVLSRTVQLPEHSETVLKAQLEKGQIDVAQKAI
jgi:hypothetical protein